MLSERSLELLTAFVDGELSPWDRKVAARLMNRSSEARQLVKDMQENAHALQQLPRRALDPDFAHSIVRLINEQKAAPVTTAPATDPVVSPTVPTPAPSTPRGRWATWTHYAMAASVLAVAATAIYFANRPVPDAGSGPIAARPDRGSGKVDESVINNLIRGTADGFAKAVPAQRTGVEFAFADLKDKQRASQLSDAIQGGQAVHLDVSVKNIEQAVAKLETAFRSQGIKLVVDKKSAGALKKPGTELVIYAENIKPQELTALLGDLSGVKTFESMTVSNVTNDDQQLVCQLLGIERKELTSPPDAGPILPKLMPKDGPGIASATKTGTPTAPARLAMALAMDARGGSPEVQWFLSQRRQLQPGALQVVVVIHQG